MTSICVMPVPKHTAKKKQFVVMYLELYFISTFSREGIETVLTAAAVIASGQL